MDEQHVYEADCDAGRCPHCARDWSRCVLCDNEQDMAYDAECVWCGTIGSLCSVTDWEAEAPTLRAHWNRILAQPPSRPRHPADSDVVQDRSQVTVWWGKA